MFRRAVSVHHATVRDFCELATNKYQRRSESINCTCVYYRAMCGSEGPVPVLPRLLARDWRASKQNLFLPTATMPSPRLPSELLDHAVDFLHDSRRTLKSCSLVSKAWIPRARKHLFAAIWLSAAKEVELWKVAFPDPSASPAWYTTALFINSPELIAAAADDDDCWVSAFSRVVHLKMDVVAAGLDRKSVV